MANIKELCLKAGITYPTMRKFLDGSYKISLETFTKLVSDSDWKALESMIERTKNSICRGAGRRSV